MPVLRVVLLVPQTNKGKRLPVSWGPLGDARFNHHVLQPHGAWDAACKEQL